MDDHKEESFTSCLCATLLQIIQKFLATATKGNNSKVTIGNLMKTSTKIIILVLITQITAQYTVNTTALDGPNSTYSKVDPKITKTEAKVDCGRDLKVRLCILEILVNRTDAAIKLFHELDDYENYALLYTIVIQAYANDTRNLPKVESFIAELPWCNHQYAGLEYLFNELKVAKHLNSSESLQFAYRLKKFLDGNPECLHVKDDENLQARVKNLKDSFPDGIRHLIWNGTKLCVRNHKFDEFLYAPEHSKYDGERRSVFTRIPKGAIGPQGNWSFEPLDGAKFFRIKNEHYQEHLYAANCCKYDSERRNVFTWTPKGDIGPQGEWSLELINESNLFKIKSSHYDEYLYAAACCSGPLNHEGRSVFSWIPKEDAGVQGEWEIAPCA